MSATLFLQLTAAVLAALGTGGIFGAWLSYRRLAPKSKAEAREITAAAKDKDWARFQREIGRLVKRLEEAEDSCSKALNALHACEQRESGLRGRIVELEAWVTAEGDARQMAAGVVAIERLLPEQAEKARLLGLKPKGAGK